MVIRDLTALAAASARGIHCSCPAQQALNFNPARRVSRAHQARRCVETERRFEKLVQPMVDAFNAHFSDRGRLFQADRGRRFSAIVDARRLRASE